ncbi:MAG: hypothetical protein HFI67_01910 [Lachnospiraceae bacterium]|jgi:hypothetical protein|nr:hypothetical protein [Lachnospiraceae bacterium]
MIVSSAATNRYQATVDINATRTVGLSKEEAAAAAAEGKKADVDTFVKSSEAVSGETKKLSATDIQKYQEQREQSFTKMLNDIVSKQANAGKKAEQLAKNGITKDFFSDLVVTPEQALAAKESIGEDGEWGVNAVATRIMDMCVALSGGDASKIEEMRAAVEKGFKQATGQWGGSLPSICGQTHDEINKRFDYWKENGSLDGYQYQRTASDSKE